MDVPHTPYPLVVPSVMGFRMMIFRPAFRAYRTVAACLPVALRCKRPAASQQILPVDGCGQAYIRHNTQGLHTQSNRPDAKSNDTAPALADYTCPPDPRKVGCSAVSLSDSSHAGPEELVRTMTRTGTALIQHGQSTSFRAYLHFCACRLQLHTAHRIMSITFWTKYA